MHSGAYPSGNQVIYQYVIRYWKETPQTKQEEVRTEPKYTMSNVLDI